MQRGGGAGVLAWSTNGTTNTTISTTSNGTSNCVVTFPQRSCRATCGIGRKLVSGNLTTTNCLSNGIQLVWLAAPTCGPSVCIAPRALLLEGENVGGWIQQSADGDCSVSYPATTCRAQCATGHYLAKGSLTTAACDHASEGADVAADVFNELTQLLAWQPNLAPVCAPFTCTFKKNLTIHAHWRSGSYFQGARFCSATYPARTCVAACDTGYQISSGGGGLLGRDKAYPHRGPVSHMINRPVSCYRMHSPQS